MSTTPTPTPSLFAPGDRVRVEEALFSAMKAFIGQTLTVRWRGMSGAVSIEQPDTRGTIFLLTRDEARRCLRLVARPTAASAPNAERHQPDAQGAR